MVIVVLDYTGILWKSKKAMIQLFGVHGKFVSFFTWPCFGSDWEPDPMTIIPPPPPPPVGRRVIFIQKGPSQISSPDPLFPPI